MLRVEKSEICILTTTHCGLREQFFLWLVFIFILTATIYTAQYSTNSMQHEQHKFSNQDCGYIFRNLFGIRKYC